MPGDDGVEDYLRGLTDRQRRRAFDFLRREMPIHPLEREWGTSAEDILGAISRSGDLTQRGIRGILAEATFESTVIPILQRNGWTSVHIVGDQAFDFQLKNHEASVRIQVKLQRKESGEPKSYPLRGRRSLIDPPATLYAVEVQKTRSGKRDGKNTRPYRFGEFDILAVNMHPSTGDWGSFLFTPGRWLLPRSAESELIEIFQPVPAHPSVCAPGSAPDRFWTADVIEAVEWLQSGRVRRLYS